MKDKDQKISAESTKAEDIFFEALEFEAGDQRSTFLETACKGDQGLRQEVDVLFESLAAAEVLFADGSPLLISAEDLVNTITNLPEYIEHTKSKSSDGAVEA